MDFTALAKEMGCQVTALSRDLRQIEILHLPSFNSINLSGKMHYEVAYMFIAERCCDMGRRMRWCWVFQQGCALTEQLQGWTMRVDWMVLAPSLLCID